MNAQEKKYTIERLTQEASNKKGAIRNDKKYRQMGLSVHQKIHLIRQGDVNFRLPENITEYTKLFDCYDFSPFNNRPALEKEMEQRIAKVDSELLRVKDIIILGEASDALTMIHDFIAKSF